MDDDELSYFEKRLTKELEAIEAQISELEGEKRALGRQLAKARAERTGLRFTTRKNSMNRVLAENSVLEKLRTATKPVSTNDLYLNALSTNYDLKQNTFRSYLHRMKKSGLIKTAKYVGHWAIVEDENAKLDNT